MGIIEKERDVAPSGYGLYILIMIAQILARLLTEFLCPQ